MEGYIHYDQYSLYSPEYPFSIGRWSSPALAIQDGEDVYSTILLFVSLRRDIFFPMRNYEFRGRYSEEMNNAIVELYRPREEEIDIDSYVYPLPTRRNIPGVSVKRNLYQLRKAGDNLYRQISALPIMEEYTLGLTRVIVDGRNEDVPIYTGDEGSFLLFRELPSTVITYKDNVGSRRNRISCTIDIPQYE